MGIEKTLNLCYFFYCVKLCAAGLHVCCPDTARLLPPHRSVTAHAREPPLPRSYSLIAACHYLTMHIPSKARAATSYFCGSDNCLLLW